MTTLSDKFPNVQFSSRQFLKGKALAAAMGAERCGLDVLGGRALRLVQDGGRGQTWEVTAWEIANLGKYPWEST